jgi:hypothetical protein
MTDETQADGLPADREHANPWADLVIAMLSTGGYSAERTYGLWEALNANGLFDPAHLANWDHEELARRLGASGYNRGDYLTGLYVERLASVAVLLDRRAESERILAHGTGEEVAALLSPVRGVGPVVVRTFMALRG